MKLRPGKGCWCWHCRHTPTKVRSAVRRPAERTFRHAARLALARGEEPEPLYSYGYVT